jgi:hypothetical protein
MATSATQGWFGPLCLQRQFPSFRCTQARSCRHISILDVPVGLGACWSEDCSREAAQKMGSALGWDKSAFILSSRAWKKSARSSCIPNRAAPPIPHRAALDGQRRCRARRKIHKMATTDDWDKTPAMSPKNPRVAVFRCRSFLMGNIRKLWEKP